MMSERQALFVGDRECSTRGCGAQRRRRITLIRRAQLTQALFKRS